MAIFDDENSRRATPGRAAIAAGAVALLLTALFALPAAATPTAPPAHVAVGDPTEEDPGGECCMRGSTASGQD